MDDEILLMIDNTFKTLQSVIKIVEDNIDHPELVRKIEFYIREKAPGDLIYVNDREQAIALRKAMNDLYEQDQKKQEKYWEEVADYYIQKYKEGFSSI